MGSVEGERERNGLKKKKVENSDSNDRGRGRYLTAYAMATLHAAAGPSLLAAVQWTVAVLRAGKQNRKCVRSPS